MLTQVRPETQQEEKFFSRYFILGSENRGFYIVVTRLIELDRLRLETRMQEKQKYEKEGKNDPDRVVKMPSQSRGGVREVYTKVKYDFLVLINFTFHKMIIVRYAMTVVKSFAMECVANNSMRSSKLV